MNNMGGIISNEQGFIDVLTPEETKVYKYNGRTYVITYDGEIYNKEEIIDDLLSRGNYLDSIDDEEVLLKGYIMWQEGILKKIEGVFSIGIWEVESKKLFLARDPIGAKSLYYSILKDGIIFANHIKYLFKNDEVKPEVTYEGISELLALGPSRRGDSAIFKNISQLKPGHYMEYSSNYCRIFKYEDFEAYENKEDFQNIADNIRELVIDSVLRQYGGDTDACTLLSGGLDSSIVTTIISEAVQDEGKKLRTFSVDYDGNDVYFKSNDFQPNSDNEWIKKMIEFCDTNHTTIKLSNKVLVDGLHEAMLLRGFPGMGDIDTSLMTFCDNMSKYVKVGLGGECADEVFGGYPWFHKDELKNSDFFPWIRSINERSEYINDEIKEKFDVLDFAKNIYNDEINKVPKLDSETDEEKRIREVGYLTYRWFLPVLLERQDKMARISDFKIRAPFCNFKLMKYVYNIPWKYRIYGDMPKGLLRYAFKDILPSEVAYRKKSPYPKTYNPEYTNLIVDEFNKVISDNNSPLLDIVDKNNVSKLMEMGIESTRPWFGQLMKGPQVMAFLIQVNDWMKEYKVRIV
jgi:asparagine synthase (glutamine-hydrolysing)